MRSSPKQLNIFSLFEEESDKAIDAKSRVTADSFFPSAKKQRVAWIERDYGNAIEQCVKSGLTVSQICKHLIKKCKAPSETFDSGKYKLYPHIMLYLDTLVDDGLCIPKQRNASEGIYEWIENVNR